MMNFELGYAIVSLLFYIHNPYFSTTFSIFLSLLFPFLLKSTWKPDPDAMPHFAAFHLGPQWGIASGSIQIAKTKTILRVLEEIQYYLEIIICDPSIHTMGHHKFIVLN